MSLVTFQRNNASRDPIAVEPAHVSALFSATGQTGLVIARLADGRGFTLVAEYADVRAQMPHLVEFERFDPSVHVRYHPEPGDVEGEDDGLSGEPAGDVPATELPRGAPIAFGANLVAAVFGSTEWPDATVIRLADGRGFVVRGSFEHVMDRLGYDGLAREVSAAVQAPAGAMH